MCGAAINQNYNPPNHLMYFTEFSNIHIMGIIKILFFDHICQTKLFPDKQMG